MKPDRYIFPAVFTYEDGKEISIVFPDLGCATSGTSESDALLNARELLGLHLFGLEEDRADIPEPTSMKNIKADDNQRVCLVDIYMPSVRSAQKAKAIL